MKAWWKCPERLHKGNTIASREESSVPHVCALTQFATEEDADLAAVQYHTYVHQFTYRRRIHVTYNGVIGMVPTSVVEGDQIAILLGGGTPFMLREVGDAHVLIRDAYVYGLMYGEALGMDGFAQQEIQLL